MEMMRDIRSHVKHWDDEDEVRAYLRKMMDGEVFDHKGLIYGMGHAVYSLSDPRERIFRGYVEKLSVAKKRDNEMNLYNTIEKVALRLSLKSAISLRVFLRMSISTVALFMRCLVFLWSFTHLFCHCANRWLECPQA